MRVWRCGGVRDSLHRKANVPADVCLTRALYFRRRSAGSRRVIHFMPLHVAWGVLLAVVICRVLLVVHGWLLSGQLLELQQAIFWGISRTSCRNYWKQLSRKWTSTYRKQSNPLLSSLQSTTSRPPPAKGISFSPCVGSQLFSFDLPIKLLLLPFCRCPRQQLSLGYFLSRSTVVLAAQVPVNCWLRSLLLRPKPSFGTRHLIPFHRYHRIALVRGSFFLRCTSELINQLTNLFI